MKVSLDADLRWRGRYGRVVGLLLAALLALFLLSWPLGWWLA